MTDNRAHARLSASGSYIWLTCTMAPALSVGLERRPSKWADEGTRAHTVAEGLLAGRGVGQAVSPLGETDATMTDWLKVYVDYVETLARQTPLYAVEKRISLKPLWEKDGEQAPEDMFGTADFVALTPDKVLHVVDLKYGANVVVEVQDNPQFLYYALGTVLSLPESVKAPDTVRMTVVQPRAPHPDGPIRSQTIPTVDLLEWGYSVLKPTVDKIARDNRDELALVEGKHCRWCPANNASACPEKRKTKQAQAKQDFADLALGD